MLTYLVKTASESLQTDCFDVCCYHLQKPIDRCRCENKTSLRFILFSLFGIVHLDQDCSFFEREEGRKQRFTNAWPLILKWLKTVFDGHYFHGDEVNWFGVVDGVFGAAFFTNGRPWRRMMHLNLQSTHGTDAGLKTVQSTSLLHQGSASVSLKPRPE